MFNVSDLVGLTEQDAVAKIKKAGFLVRVRDRDGISFIGTADVKMNRVNLYIEKNLVTEARLG